MKQELIDYILKNGKDLSWSELATKFNLATGEIARHIWRKYKADQQGLQLKSRWQANTKDGVVWMESYKATNNEANQLNLAEIIETIQPKQFDIRGVATDNNIIGLYYLSDEHIGADVKEGLYNTSYNESVFKYRLETIYNKIFRHAQVYGTFKHLIIGNLGDSIDGYNAQTTRGGHILPQNLDIKRVFEVYIDVHMNFLYSLQAAGIAENLYYVGVSESNHGGDIEYLCHKGLEYAMKQTDVKFCVMENFMDHFIIGDHCFIFTHGKDKLDRKRNMPLNLTQDVENFIKQYIDINDLGKYTVSVIKGDLHQSASQTGKFFRYRNTASIFGSSKWSMINFGYTAPACDYDIIVDDEIIEGRIILDSTIKTNAKFTI